MQYLVTYVALFNFTSELAVINRILGYQLKGNQSSAFSLYLKSIPVLYKS